MTNNKRQIANKVKINKAKKEDIPAIVKVASACFRGMKDFKKAKKWINCNFKAFPRTQYFVAKYNQLVLGYILWMEKGGFRKKAVIELEQIAVLPDFQNKEIGSKMIKESLKEIKKYLKKRESKLKLIEISTGTTNKAQRLYKKTLNAKVKAVIKDLFRGDEVIMIARFS